MVEKNSFKEILRQKLINLAKKTIFTAKDRTSFTRRYKFEDRSKNSDTLCIILAGYKENLWDIVFDRIDKSTLTGKLVYPVTDKFIVQWEEMRKVYPKSINLGSIF